MNDTELDVKPYVGGVEPIMFAYSPDYSGGRFYFQIGSACKGTTASCHVSNETLRIIQQNIKEHFEKVENKAENIVKLIKGRTDWCPSIAEEVIRLLKEDCQ